MLIRFLKFWSYRHGQVTQEAKIYTVLFASVCVWVCVELVCVCVCRIIAYIVSIYKNDLDCGFSFRLDIYNIEYIP